MKCKNCEEKEAAQYSKYTSGEFCSKECSRSYSTKNNRKEINNKISKTMVGKKRGNNDVKIECNYCKKEFEVEWKRRGQKLCSRSCSSSWKNTELGVGRIAGLASVKSQSENRRSKNEVHFAKLCKKYFNKVLTNEQMFNGWDADVIIEDIKFAVLWNGKWHYEKITEQHSVSQVKNRDKIKIKEIEAKGYKHYTIKDMGKENKAFVEKEFDKFICFLKQNDYICVR